MKYNLKKPAGFSERKIKIKIPMKFLLIFLFLPFHLLAQINTPLPKNLPGVWTGYMYNDTTGLNNDFELAISENKGKLSGYTYTIFIIDGKKNIGVKAVKVKERKDLLLIEDDKLISNNYDAPPAKGVRTFIELHYSENDTSEILSGSWKTNVTRQYNSVTGSLFLQRKKKPEETAIISKLRQLDLSDQLSFLPKSVGSQQKNSIISTTLPDDSKVSSISKNVTVENKTKDVAGRVKNDEPKSETVKIIPDTTITNPEITIFMFPKNNLPAKDTIKFEEKKNVLVVAKDSFEVKSDKLLLLADRKAEKIKLPDGNSEKGINELAVISPKKTGNSTPVPPAKKIAAEKLSEREIETIRTVEIMKDTLIFSLFDNGVIDGDTVSVLLNGKVIISRIGLLARAYNDTIYLTPEMGDSINIILYAENLGSIPPNTGLLVVRDGDIDHEIRFSGDLKKNSAIILKRKRKLNER